MGGGRRGFLRVGGRGEGAGNKRRELAGSSAGPPARRSRAAGEARDETRARSRIIEGRERWATGRRHAGGGLPFGIGLGFGIETLAFLRLPVVAEAPLVVEING
jgi:hypothetical protein